MDERNRPALKWIVAIVALCGVGAWISGELVQAHAGLWSAEAGTGTSGAGLFARVCRASQSFGFDCTGSVRSSWSQFTIPIPLPTRALSIELHRTVVPVAFVGLAYFVFLGAWFAFTNPEYVRLRLPYRITRAGAVISVACLAAMTTGVAPLCVWCVLTHFVSLTLAAIVERLRSTRSAPAVVSLPAEEMFRVAARRAATRACAIGLILVAGLWYYRREQLSLGSQVRGLLPYRKLVTDLRNDPDFLLREHFAQAAMISSVDSRASDDCGDAVLTVFMDFECSACLCTSRRLERFIVPAFEGDVVLDVRHFPLNEECNEAVTGRMHPNACEAAYAAEAARMQGGDEAFVQMSGLLFEHRDPLSPDTYRELAAQVGLDVERFERDYEGEDVRRIVREDVSLARRLGVNATPAVFLDGRRVSAFGVDNPVFWEAVAASEQPAAENARASAE